MNTKLLVLCYLIFNILNIGNAEAQTRLDSLKHRAKNIGLKISLKNFNNTVDSLNAKMERNDTLKVDEFIKAVRVDNTISFDFMDNNQRYLMFRKLYTPRYTILAIAALNAHLSKGMCYYSEKYDLYLGCAPHFNSKYSMVQSPSY